MIIGGEPHIQHFDGTSWTEIALPIEDEDGETSIWGSGPADVYVAVERLYHFDGNGWQRTPVDAQRVTGTSADNVFAIDGRTVVHFDGTEWDTLLTTSYSRYFRSGSAAPDGSLWIAANDSFLVWNGSIWTRVPPIDARSPYSVVAFSADDAVTWWPSYTYPPVTKFHRWNGTQWQLESTVTGFVTAVGRDGMLGMYAVGEQGLVTHFDGLEWDPLSRPTALDLRVIAETAAGQIVVAGERGKVVALDGSAWQLLREGTLRQAFVLWAESPSRILVSDSEALFEISGQGWIENVLPVATGVHALGGRALDDVYASLYDASVLHFDGESWAVSADSLIGCQYIFWTSPSGTVFSAGERSVYRFLGNWETLLEGDFRFNVITGDAAGHLLVAGDSWIVDTPVIKLFDGTSWRDLPAPPGWVGSAWMGPGMDLYLAGSDGLLRWDGKQFIRLTPARSEFFRYVDGSSGRVIAIGQVATAVYDGVLVNLEHVQSPGLITLARDGTFVGTNIADGVAAWRP